ncbi:MAG TPA: MBL fold metallo-hydrolase, partial [Usitatibacter sp.]
MSVADGVWWIRMPLPFALDHVNLWILEDGDGFTLVDTGFGAAATWELWERHFAGVLADRPVKNVIVTHYHPDHIGSAG